MAKEIDIQSRRDIIFVATDEIRGNNIKRKISANWTFNKRTSFLWRALLQNKINCASNKFIFLLCLVVDALNWVDNLPGTLSRANNIKPPAKRDRHYRVSRIKFYIQK